MPVIELPLVLTIYMTTAKLPNFDLLGRFLSIFLSFTVLMLLTSIVWLLGRMPLNHS